MSQKIVLNLSTSQVPHETSPVVRVPEVILSNQEHTAVILHPYATDKPEVSYVTFTVANPSILEINQLCRTCAQQQSNMVDILSNKGHEFGLRTKLELVLNTPINQDDLRPQKMCEICVSALCSAFEFKEKFMDAEKKFKSMTKSLREEKRTGITEKLFVTMNEKEPVIDTVESEELSEEMIKVEEPIVQIIMNEVDPDITISESINVGFPKGNTTNIDSSKGTTTDITPQKAQNCSKSSIIDETEEQRREKILEKYKIYEKIPLRKMQCPICTKVEEGILNLINHHLQCHFRFVMNTCVVCLVSFKTKEEFTKHVDENHSKTITEKTEVLSLQTDTVPRRKNPKCGKCQLTFTTTSQYINHYLRNHKSHFKCSDCEKEFRKIEDWKNHRRRHKTRQKLIVKSPRCCEYCEFSAKTKKELSKHVVKEHKDKLSKFVCVCSKEFNTKVAFKTHMQNTHITKGRNYACEQCGESFKHKVTLTQHRYRHLSEAGKRKMECAVCNKYVTVATFIHHMSRHFTQRPYSCPVCHIGITLKANLERHMLSHKGKTFECHVCTLIFPTKVEFVKHQPSHGNDTGTYTCPICEDFCRTYKGMASHCRHVHKKEELSKHFNITPTFKCQKCTVTFESQVELSTHYTVDDCQYINVDSHLKPIADDNLRCNFCLHLSSDVSSYFEHRKTHPEAYSLKCKYCNQRFRNMRSRNAHELSHTNEKPFQCDLCQSSFSCKDYLRTHQFTKHNAGPVPLPCNLCDKTFPSTTYLNRHLQSHKKQSIPIYKCDFCDKTFRAKTRCKTHMESHQTIKIEIDNSETIVLIYPFQCNGCGQAFKTKREKSKHEALCDILQPQIVEEEICDELLSIHDENVDDNEAINVLVDTLYP